VVQSSLTLLPVCDERVVRWAGRGCSDAAVPCCCSRVPCSRTSGASTTSSPTSSCSSSASPSSSSHVRTTWAWPPAVRLKLKPSAVTVGLPLLFPLILLGVMAGLTFGLSVAVVAASSRAGRGALQKV
jgi:hypothetical protein